MNRRPLARLATMAALALVMGCEANVATTILNPTGRPPVEANSSISGRVEFGSGSYPQSLVLIAPVLDPSCISSYSKIGISGTLVAAGFNPAAAPQLTQLAPCFWVDTLTILAGTPAEWKFTTNDNFDDNPDYGGPGTVLDGLAGIATNPAPGPEGNLTANVTAGDAGLVVCFLDETNPPEAPYAFQKIGAGSPAAFTSTGDGSFTVSGLQPGAYNVLVRTPGSLKDTLITNLFVSGPTSVGTLVLGSVAPGSVSGTIDYAGPNGFTDLASAPYPPTTVQLKQGLAIVANTTTGRASNTFAFANVAPGTYEIVVDAPVFQPLTKAAIAVGPGANTDAGAFQLVRTNVEVSNSVNVAGNFNSFAKDDPLWEMNQSALGVWQLTSPSNITAGDQFMKFVTDFNFDLPPDYGGDETVTITVPVTNAETRKVSGSGTALKLNFPATGNYTFTLDERRQTFSVVSAPAPARIARRSRP